MMNPFNALRVGKTRTNSPGRDWVAPTWEELVKDHSGRIYRLALRLTNDPHDAEDLTQEVFIKAFKSIHKFQPGTLNGWLNRITVNLFLDSVRRNKRIRMDALSGAPDHMWGQVSDAASNRDDQTFDPDVAAALANLPPEHRIAVILCDIEQLSYEEIAEVLDIKLGTVRSRIHRGRKQLRAALAHRQPTGDRSRYLGVDT